jgi:hypothetical protein
MIVQQTSRTTSLRGNAFIKAAVLLTVGLFLVSAPAPDSRILEEMTSHLISISKNPALGP